MNNFVYKVKLTLMKLQTITSNQEIIKLVSIVNLH